MVDHVGVLHVMVGDARQIDHVLALAAAGDPNVGLTCFTRTVDDTAEPRERHRCLDVLQPLFEGLDRADDVEALASAAWAGNDPNAAAADPEALEEFIANANLFLRFSRQ